MTTQSHACQRSYAHRPHLFLQGDGTDGQCPGRGVEHGVLASLLDRRPVLAEVGTASRAAALGVMCA